MPGFTVPFLLGPRMDPGWTPDVPRYHRIRRVGVSRPQGRMTTPPKPLFGTEERAWLGVLVVSSVL
ncbi:hypothetical protein GCM10027294_53480 [Marinactinospora endophytica]